MSDSSKFVVHEWGNEQDIIVDDELSIQFEEKFDVSEIIIHDAKDDEGTLMLKVESSAWSGIKEFGFLECGSLIWD